MIANRKQQSARRARRTLIATLVLLGLLSTSADALAESCDRTMSDNQVEGAIVALDELPVDKLMLALEARDQCDNLQRIAAGLDTRFDDHKRVLAGIWLVTTVGRDPASTNTSGLLRAAELTGQLSFASQSRALMSYAVDKLAQAPDNEPLFALLDGPTPNQARSTMNALAAGTTGRIDPAAWSPPGGQPIPFYIGNEAHKAIADFYEAANSHSEIEFNSTPISTILQRLFKLDVGPAANKTARAKGALALRPDIVNLSTLEIYEIKPAGLVAQAEARVSAYLAAFLSAGVTMKPGRTDAPGTVGAVPAPAGHYRFWTPAPGVIVYRYHRGAFAPVPVRSSVPSKVPGLSPAPVPVRRAQASPPARGVWARMSRATGLTGTSLLMYLILSEGTRVIPARNLVPIL